MHIMQNKIHDEERKGKIENWYYFQLYYRFDVHLFDFKVWNITEQAKAEKGLTIHES